MTRRPTRSSTRRTEPKGRPAERGEALIRLLKKKPGMTPTEVATLWKTTRQNVWNIAQRQGIRMAGGRQKWASGL